uniref:Uncharacterized protein n=1 Tax=Macaca fascicularis TaxID=9541 RepID=A0A7N9CWK2_MACFA
FCHKIDLHLIQPCNFIQCLECCILQRNSSRVHVQDMQISYIGNLCPCLC